MKIDRPVVVGIDGSDVANTALRWAARYAAGHEVQLIIVNALGDPVVFGSRIGTVTTDIEPIRAASRKLLAQAKIEVATIATAGGMEVATQLTASSPASTLIDMSKDASMVVVGNRGLGAFRRGLLGSVSTALAHHAQCPVAVLHEASPDSPGSDGPIVVGVDGTPNSVPAIEIAFDEADRRDAELIAVHGWVDTSDFDFPVEDWSGAMRAEEEKLDDDLAVWRKQYPDVRLTSMVVRDRPIRNLFEQSENAQLLVLGSHGRGGFAGMMLGSTSQALLHSVECPVIIARGPS